MMLWPLFLSRHIGVHECKLHEELAYKQQAIDKIDVLVSGGTSIPSLVFQSSRASNRRPTGHLQAAPLQVSGFYTSPIQYPAAALRCYLQDSAKPDQGGTATRLANYLCVATWLLSVSHMLVHSRSTNTDASDVPSCGARPQGQSTSTSRPWVCRFADSFAISP